MDKEGKIWWYKLVTKTKYDRISNTNIRQIAETYSWDKTRKDTTKLI